jgi:hypothetical protein
MNRQSRPGTASSNHLMEWLMQTAGICWDGSKEKWRWGGSSKQKELVGGYLENPMCLPRWTCNKGRAKSIPTTVTASSARDAEMRSRAPRRRREGNQIDRLPWSRLNLGLRGIGRVWGRDGLGRETNWEESESVSSDTEELAARVAMAKDHCSPCRACASLSLYFNSRWDGGTALPYLIGWARSQPTGALARGC